MRKFLNVVTDRGVIQDPEGEVFGTFSDAILAAEDTARELMANALKSRRLLQLRWRIEIADENGRIEATISFASVGLGYELSQGSCRHPS
ncbi:MAG: hypothetical protein EKK41_21100 [Hyphomicrobiales bacterium]|nr:MAG: hypothetical protein EKK41_21100 [Hyphomicrobiales bacterium]